MDFSIFADLDVWDHEYCGSLFRSTGCRIAYLPESRFEQHKLLNDLSIQSLLDAPTIGKNGTDLAETICRYFSILSSSLLTWAWKSVEATKVSNADGGKFADFLLFL